MYVVIELQKVSDDAVAPIVTTHATRNEAENKYHTILAYAALSPALYHSAVMIDEMGNYYKSAGFEHKPAEE